MRVQHNIMAMNSYRNYNNNSSSINKNIEKLSSGYQINRAGDNAAGLAISEKMRAQITGLEVAQKNAKDGISLVQTAEGALTEVHSMLNRMYELAEQSANGTYSNEVDRAQLQKEVASLKTEINRIADSANFNGTKLLNGDLSVGGSASTASLAGGAGPTATLSATAATMGIDSITLGSAGADGDAISYKVEAEQDGQGSATVKVTVGAGATATEYSALITSGQTSTSLTLHTNDNSDSVTVTLTAAGLAAALAVGAGEDDGYGDVTYTDISDTNIGAVSDNSQQNNPQAGLQGGGTAGATSASGPLTLQIGDDSNTWNQMKVSIDDIHVSKLGTYTTTPASGDTPAYKVTDAASQSAAAPTTIADIDISNQDQAAKALDVIKNAINYVSDTRGGLGAIQNRLEHTINNLSVMQENMQDAESTIRDTDVAAEMMKYTKNSILVQSAQAMLAQANQQPQGVLQLLQ